MKSFLFVLFVMFFMSVHAQRATDNYISTQAAIRRYAGILKGNDFIVFPEWRENPIKWLDSLKPAWIDEGPASKLYVLHAQPGEYFVFQAGIWAIGHDLKNIGVHFSNFINETGGLISSREITCFNGGGINYQGKPFIKKINVHSGQVQALWMGINLSSSAKGKYTGVVIITANGVSRSIKLRLVVDGAIVANHGWDEGGRLARLEWLNSTVGMNDTVTKGAIPIERTGKLVRIFGRSMEISGSGLPEAITTYFTASNQSVSGQGAPIIKGPFRLVIEKADGTLIHLQPGPLQFTAQSPSFITWRVVNTSDVCDVICDGRVEYDGFVDYHLTVKAKRDLPIRDIRLQVGMDKDKATYMMGLNRPGGLRPAAWNWGWDTTKNQDDLWLGAVNGGLRIKWKAENYVSPLINVYYSFGRLHLPPSWGNDGKGGVTIAGKEDEVTVNAYSGSRRMKKGEQQHYDFQLLITPFKTIDHSVQFGARYYHSAGNVKEFIPEADSLGANIINLHHGTEIYPFINYPYSDVNAGVLKDFISDVHKDHKRAKVYYTTRELTINLPELWPFLSLDGEVIYPGPGVLARTITDPKGPDPWLLENLRGRKYIPAWVVHFTKGRYAGMQDLSVITTPDSRLNNFYVAGLDWMTHHFNMDGIYIDDCSLDRTTLQRVRKLLDGHNADANIDMHTWNHFNAEAGWASSINLYMDLAPYIDQFWIGEGRNYDTPADYWLVEISGIPFGLPSQMLEGGGNPWRGMLYGMTTRAGWTGSQPDHLWRFFDQYAIRDKETIGYWDPNSPIITDNDSIKVSVYKGAEESILAVGNFGETDQSCSLTVDYARLGYDAKKSSFEIPGVAGYQESRSLPSLDHLRIPGKKGYLIVIRKNG